MKRLVLFFATLVFVALSVSAFPVSSLPDTIEVVAEIPGADDFRPFSEGLAAVRMHGCWGYVDVSGAWVVSNDYDAALDFHHGLALVKLGEDYYYINRQGNTVLGPFEDGWEFGYYGGDAPIARAKVGGLYRWIDRKGEYVRHPDARENEHLVCSGPVPKGGFTKYPNRALGFPELGIGYIFNDAVSFNEGYSIVEYMGRVKILAIVE